jgi:hypothetical protein
MPRGVDEHLDDADSFVPGWGALTARSVDAEALPLDGPEGAHTHTPRQPRVDLTLIGEHV